jgi:hypothetical protein
LAGATDCRTGLQLHSVDKIGGVAVSLETKLRWFEADAAIAARNERDFSVKLAHLFLPDVRFFSPLTSTV